ncbi:MAG: hypothetical protein R2834_00155 [Rhodothermales bacterium]
MAHFANTFSRPTLSLDGLASEKANDDMIERYVRFTASLDEAAHGTVNRSLQRHMDAAAVERFYRQFYETYDAMADETPPRVKAFVDALFDE